MEIRFDKNATRNQEVEKAVKIFLENVETAEETRDVPVFIHQDGVRKSYYIHCILDGKTIAKVVCLDARLNPENGEPFRANRELLLTHNTFLRMKTDSENGREFNDIIAEYITSYLPKTPLKIWGGQHRARAIIEAFQQKKVSRHHGFRIYFCL
ncbi:MAG: hypothetical protein HY529_02710, partial [Chloroflexi bacterium]|nr:hypothetical protein [Chloroflexota bacterium]